MYTRRVSPQTTFQHRRVDHSVHEVKVRVVFERRANAFGILYFEEVRDNMYGDTLIMNEIK
jgi:hypothetical protein